MTASRLLAAGAAALATAAVLAASGTAAAGHHHGRTLHFTSTSQPGVGFFPSGAPEQGSTFGFGDTVTGSDHGNDRGICTVVGSEPVCTVDVRLSRGTLAIQGRIPQHPRNAPLAVVGGTGAYKDAGGTARATEVDATTTKIVVSLVR